MWRPKDWQADIIILEYLKKFINPRRTDEEAILLKQAVEAGADALLRSYNKWLLGRLAPIAGDDYLHVFKLTPEEHQQLTEDE